MKIKKTRCFFSCPSDLSLQSYCPFQSIFILLHCKPVEAQVVNKISEEPLELRS